MQKLTRNQLNATLSSKVFCLNGDCASMYTAVRGCQLW